MSSTAERKRREDLVRKLMDRHAVDWLVVPGRAEATHRGYLHYLTDWFLWGGAGALLLPRRGEPVLLLGSNSQARWARQLGWIADVRGTFNVAADAAAVLKSQGARGRIGVAGLQRLLTLQEASLLENAVYTLVDATPVLESARLIKSEEEIAALERTSRIVADAIRAFGEALAPGRTERDVVSAAHRVARNNGCLDGIAHVSVEEPPYVHPPTDRRFSSDDIVKFSMEFCGPSGHWVELSAVFSFREPPSEVRKQFDVTLEAFSNVANLLRPGTPGAKIPSCVTETFRTAGLEPVARAIWDAHGIGLDVIEPPILLPDAETELVENQAINVHPGLLVGDMQRGMYIQDNFIVTPAGGRRLSGLDHRWNLV
jgi:Xaa-Pro aminopeptidase